METPVESLDRLWDRIIVGPSCWEWQGTKTKAGYGVVPREWTIKICLVCRELVDLCRCPYDREIADLVRKGEIELGDLVEVTPMEEGEDMITQRSHP